MQKRRAQRLCFNYNERFSAVHKHQGMKLLLLEGPTDITDVTSEEVHEEVSIEALEGDIVEPEITLHALIG